MGNRGWAAGDYRGVGRQLIVPEPCSQPPGQRRWHRVAVRVAGSGSTCGSLAAGGAAGGAGDRPARPDPATASEVELACTDVGMLVAAIQRLAVRGAPLLGVVGGYGVALAAARAGGHEPTLRAEAARLADARPTAVNLGWACLL